MSNFNDDALLQEFVAESKEHLSTVEPDLLIMERDGDNTDPAVVNSIFRAIHSIKGASGFFGLEAIKNLSHVMENLLMLFRDKKMSPTPEAIEPLLMGVDKLNTMLEDIAESENVPYQDEIARLEAILSGKPPSTVNTEVKLPETPDKTEAISLDKFELDPVMLESAKTNGQKLFAIEIRLDTDLTKKNRNPLSLFEQFESMGLVLDNVWDVHTFSTLETCMEEESSFYVLFATVLDADLISLGMEVDKEQIKTVLWNDSDEAAPTAAPQAAAPSVSAPEAPAAAPVAAAEEQAPSEPTSNEPHRKSSEAVETVRVRVDLLNKLMDLAGEMVLSRNQLLRTLNLENIKTEGLENIIQNIDMITSDLQEHIMQTRMQPIGSVFGKFPRVIRDMARILGKEIELVMSGEDVELDKSLIESLSDPLTHLIRNCCDHGLEPTEEREKVGKPRQGNIQLKAYHEDGQINIAIIDDGRGIDHEKIAKKALQHGLVTDADLQKMSVQEMVNLIFMPGLSTAEKVSDVSGRGVGMDVVKTNIVKIGGTIHIDTTKGKGTTIILKLPLTLAIIPSLTVGVCNQRFAMPQINLVELVRIRASEIATRVEKVGNASVLRLRDKLLPLLRLADVLDLKRTYFSENSGNFHPDRRLEIADSRLSEEALNGQLLKESNLSNKREQPESDYNVLVLKVGVHQFGLIVDELFDTEEIVVKPLSSYIKNCKCFAGSTIMGDGCVAMILDPAGILAYANINFDEVESEKRRLDMEKEARAQELVGNRQTILLFHNALDEHFAIPLASVLRLEKIDLSKIERVGRDEYLTYGGRGLPLIRLENHLPVKEIAKDTQEAYLIIPRHGNGAAGIMASRIIDTLETHLTIDESKTRAQGIKGSMVVNDHLTLFIEPEGLLSQAGIQVAEEAAA